MSMTDEELKELILASLTGSTERNPLPYRDIAINIALEKGVINSIYVPYADLEQTYRKQFESNMEELMNCGFVRALPNSTEPFYAQRLFVIANASEN